MGLCCSSYSVSCSDNDKEVQHIKDTDFTNYSFDEAMDLLERAFQFLEDPRYEDDYELYQVATELKNYCDEKLKQEKNEIDQITKDNDVD